jgi:hypothetical protein
LNPTFELHNRALPYIPKLKTLPDYSVCLRNEDSKETTTGEAKKPKCRRYIKASKERVARVVQTVR